MSASAHYSAAPCEPAKTSAGCRATHQYVFTLTVHTNTSNFATIKRPTSAPSMTINYPVVITPRDGRHASPPELNKLVYESDLISGTGVS